MRTPQNRLYNRDDEPRGSGTYKGIFDLINSSHQIGSMIRSQRSCREQEDMCKYLSCMLEACESGHTEWYRTSPSYDLHKMRVCLKDILCSARELLVGLHHLRCTAWCKLLGNQSNTVAYSEVGRPSKLATPPISTPQLRAQLSQQPVDGFDWFIVINDRYVSGFNIYDRI